MRTKATEFNEPRSLGFFLILPPLQDRWYFVLHLELISAGLHRQPHQGFLSLLQCRGTWSLPKSSSCFIKAWLQQPCTSQAKKGAVRGETKGSRSSTKQAGVRQSAERSPVLSLGFNVISSYFNLQKSPSVRQCGREGRRRAWFYLGTHCLGDSTIPNRRAAWPSHAQVPGSMLCAEGWILGQPLERLKLLKSHAAPSQEQ